MLLLNDDSLYTFVAYDRNFNTSYVVIKHVELTDNSGIFKNFNTSYVVIKRAAPTFQTAQLTHFNTSYVVIKPFWSHISE